MFVVNRDGKPDVLVNEIAPRVHNSGHWTLDGASISQFEQHIRAIAGWPLGKPLRHGEVTMTNLIGDEINNYTDGSPFPAPPSISTAREPPTRAQDGPCHPGRAGGQNNP